MSDIGKAIRLRRIIEGGRSVVVPMDHGTSNGPISGVRDIVGTVRKVAAGGASSIVVHKGLVPHIAHALGDTALTIHISASTDKNPDPNDKRLVATVDECIALGADMVSVHVNVGSPTESRMVADLGAVAGACRTAGMPLLAMMYPRGHDIDDPHDPELVAHVARLGAELGADLVKCPYTGDPGTFEAVVEGCPVPIIISGGPRMDTPRELYEMVQGALDAGAAGVSIGRNVFQSPDPERTTRALARLVLERQPLKSVLEQIA